MYLRIMQLYYIDKQGHLNVTLYTNWRLDQAKILALFISISKGIQNQNPLSQNVTSPYSPQISNFYRFKKMLECIRPIPFHFPLTQTESILPELGEPAMKRERITNNVKSWNGIGLEYEYMQFPPKLMLLEKVVIFYAF